MIKCIINTSILLFLLLVNPIFAKNDVDLDSTKTLFSLTATGNILSIKPTIPGAFYQFAGINNITPGFTLSNCIYIDSDNGYCMFSASDTVPATPSILGPAIQPEFNVCLNGRGKTYSCERAKIGYRFAYITNYVNNRNPTISLCPINPDGTFGSCKSSGNTGISFSNPYQIALNNLGTSAYITNSGDGTVLLCPININGTFGNCTDSGAGNIFGGTSGIVLNRLGTIAYVTNPLTNGGNVFKCPISPNGTFGACIDSGNMGINFNTPNGIALNNNGTVAYIANANNNANFVSKCPINADGSFGVCIDSGAIFSGPLGVVLNSAGTIAYVTNGSNNTVSKCQINAFGGFSSCTDSGAGSIFNQPFGISLNASGTTAYIANGESTNVSTCTINVDGSFKSCTNAANEFNEPLYITMF
jgi:hypothetical protein